MSRRKSFLMEVGVQLSSMSPSKLEEDRDLTVRFSSVEVSGDVDKSSFPGRLE